MCSLMYMKCNLNLNLERTWKFNGNKTWKSIPRRKQIPWTGLELNSHSIEMTTWKIRVYDDDGHHHDHHIKQKKKKADNKWPSGLTDCRYHGSQVICASPSSHCGRGDDARERTREKTSQDRVQSFSWRGSGSRPKDHHWCSESKEFERKTGQKECVSIKDKEEQDSLFAVGLD